MIFKMRAGYKKDGVQLYLLIEQDANGTFFGVYDDVKKAKECDGALSLVVIPKTVVDKCQAEHYDAAFADQEQALKNSEMRQLVEEYSK